MRNIKRIVAALSAAVTCINSGVISVSAVTKSYDPLDVNKDGYVDVADVVRTNLYLEGKLYQSDYNCFDVNGSLTIDSVDSGTIMSYVAMLPYASKYFSRKSGKEVAYPTVSGFKPDSSASSTDPMSYMRYSYTDKEQLDDYSLKPVGVSGDTRSIVDDLDTRYAAYGEENTGIVKLKYGNSDIATGFIIDDHHIATAARCVYNRDNHSWNSMDITTYDSNGLQTNTKLTPVEAHIPKFYVSKGTTRYDYALITVKEDLSDYVHFDLGTSYNVTKSDYSKVPLYVTGCPDSVNGSTNTSKRLYSDEGHVVGDNNNASVLHYDMFTSDGNSGSPVYTITRTNKDGNISYIYTALAIHHAHSSFSNSNGSMITKYQLQFYRNNPNIGY